MARGTTARDPVTWQLRRCLAASTLSSRVRRFGACVVLHQASLGLFQLAFVSVCGNVFACIFHGDRRSALAVLCHVHLPIQTRKCNISVGNPYIDPACLRCCGAMM
jgi:hypothetical protein